MLEYRLDWRDAREPLQLHTETFCDLPKRYYAQLH